ncbi:flagellar biosynthesis protein FlgN [Palleronia sp. KMU-117]|uniref:flagellar biosynthesis protein FlgN n=1 Tax=Palleronia sp. KMU-117 TaxID=3434108 RepID=UPI003D75C819
MARPDPIGALEDLLERERRLILSGRLADLGRHAEAKARIVDALSREVRDPRHLDRLRAAASRNQGLLDAAAEGIREVRDRLTDMRRSVGSLATYSSDGERHVVSTTPGQLERRA